MGFKHSPSIITKDLYFMCDAANAKHSGTVQNGGTDVNVLYANQRNTAVGTVTGNFASIGQDGENTMVQLYKNGSAIKASKINQSSSTGQNNREITITASGIFALSASDTVELYGELQDANASGNATVKAGRTSITGFKLIS